MEAKGSGFPQHPRSPRLHRRGAAAALRTVAAVFKLLLLDMTWNRALGADGAASHESESVGTERAQPSYIALPK